jgi:corrinoid protein of di/trimethylamine methyltransferase
MEDRGMVEETKKKELIERLKNGVIQYDEDAVKEAASEAVALGMDANEAIFDGLVSGMEEVGRLFESQEYFVPELLMCADALYAGLDILKPHVVKVDIGVKGSVVIGTVEGDVHDIGKNIVKMMFDVAGFNVYDLGRDVPLDKFVEEQIRTDSDMVCLSAMMTTTMVGMQKVIENLKKKNPDVIIMIGGAPVSKDLADKWGADGYAADASNALKEAISMISSLKKLRAEARVRKAANE